MVFNPEQIDELLKIVEHYSLLFVVENVNPDILTKRDRELLELSGFDLNSIGKKRLVEEAYKFGMLSSLLKKEEVQGMDYEKFKHYLVEGQFIPLNRVEKGALESLEYHAYSDIKGLGNRIIKDIQGLFLIEDKKQREKYEEVIKDEMKEGLKKRKSLSEIILGLGHKTEDWARDFGRIADFIMHSAMDEGRAKSIERKSGEGALVYKDVYPGACDHCIDAYLTGSLGSAPRIFKLSELKANGTNVGRKTSSWRPVIGPMHPNCFSDDTEVLTNKGWRLFKDLTLKEKFLSVNLETGNSEWVKAVDRVEYQYDGIMHHIKSRDFDSLTTPDHNHVVFFEGWSKKIGQLRLIQGTKLPRESKFLRTIPNWRGKEYKTIKVGSVEFESRDWFTFMGWYISEGSLVHQENDRWEINITQLKVGYREEIISLCNKLFDKIWVGQEDIVIPINLRLGKYDSEFIEHFTKLGKSYEKYLPEYLKESSIDLIKLFLQSYCKGDGTFDKSTKFEGYIFKGQRHFCTSSNQLAADIGELLLKIGKKPSYTLQKSIKYEGYDCREVWVIYEGNSQYTLRVDRNKDIVIDRLKEVRYSGMVYDVELEKYHTLVVRRNGRVWVSGNCRCTLNEVPQGFTWDEEKKDFRPPKKEGGTGYERKVQRKSKVRVQVGEENFEV